MSGPDRRAALAAQNLITGIDFASVTSDQLAVHVFFLTPPLALVVPLDDLALEQLEIRGAAGEPPIDLASAGWVAVDGRDVLRLEVASPGGFAPVRLHIHDPRVDPYFNGVLVDFKAACPSQFDCEPRPAPCPPGDPDDVVIDTTARDFHSFRRALLEFASQRHPDWKDRLEADVGVMLVEVMSALGDEMAYYQDRIAREAALDSASQRRSVRRHARLVDYHLHDGRSAAAWIDVDVDPSFSGEQPLPAGTALWAEADGGSRVHFEIGRGLAEVRADRAYPVSAARNRLEVHIWDEEATCLPVGATALHLAGHHTADLPLDDFSPGRPPGRWMLLRTDPTDPSLPARRHLIRAIRIVDEIDPLGVALGTGAEVTRVEWEVEQALPFEMDLETLGARGNLVPATAGRTQVRRFSVGPTTRPDVPPAVERFGPDGSPAFLHTLDDEEGEGLVWLGDRLDSTRPELELHEGVPPDSTSLEGEEWEFRRSLLASSPLSSHFTLDDGSWVRVVGFRRLVGPIAHRDYRSGEGVTIRFGDGEFGRIPARGQAAHGRERFFEARYRLGGGKRGNLAADAIRGIDPAAAFVRAVSNPLPATGGVDPETIAEARRDAPDAFRVDTFRAVRPEDYADAAERLPWVERAGASMRWTGSWPSAFVTPDPRGTSQLERPRRRELEELLDRVRQAAREVHVRAPRYADLDLVITICVEPNAYPGDVAEAVLALLSAANPSGFFHPDRFSFGTPLDRSTLEATVQGVPGVRAVVAIAIARRGQFTSRPFAELVFQPALDEVVRVESDPARPGRGTIRIVTEGGA